MKEIVCRFGRYLHLAGVATLPESGRADARAPMVLMLNAGLLHRVGPHRMSVVLARQLAEAGIASFRFDIGGRGDSESGTDAEGGEQQALADIVDAMDFAGRRFQVDKFVTFGLCAGADRGHAMALNDARIVGGILLDGHGFRTLGYYFKHYLPRLLRVKVWLNLLRRHLTREPADDAAAELNQRRPFGARESVSRELQTLVDRGARMLYIYTGGVAQEYYNYGGQFWDMFHDLDARGRIAVEYFPDSDHTFTHAADRGKLLNAVGNWLRNFPGLPPHDEKRRPFS
jgi:hypothetical protein